MCELGLGAAGTHFGEQKLTAQAVARTHSSRDSQRHAILLCPWGSCPSCVGCPTHRLQAGGRSSTRNVAFPFPSKRLYPPRGHYLNLQCGCTGGEEDLLREIPSFSKSKKEREKPRGHCDVPLTPLEIWWKENKWRL